VVTVRIRTVQVGVLVARCDKGTARYANQADEKVAPRDDDIEKDFADFVLVFVTTAGEEMIANVRSRDTCLVLNRGFARHGYRGPSYTRPLPDYPVRNQIRTTSSTGGNPGPSTRVIRGHFRGAV
jgi:hypothetical protein